MKKPNGGYRTQRVQVLASGKYKFVKNKTRGKSAAPRRRKTTAKRKTTTYRRRKTSMARRKRTRRSRKPTFPLGLLVPGLLGTVDFCRDVYYAAPGDRGSVAIERVSGWHPKNNTWAPEEATFTLGWGAGAIIHKGVGGYLGVNRMLAANNVPFIRV